MAKCIYAKDTVKSRSIVINDESSKNCITLPNGDCIGTKGCMHDPPIKKNKRIAEIAEILHKEYRAAFKALYTKDLQERNMIGCPSSHDHGYVMCNKKKYFEKRAERLSISFNLC